MMMTISPSRKPITSKKIFPALINSLSARKSYCLDEIENEKGQWYYEIIDAVFEEGTGGSGQEPEMPAEENERGYSSS